MYMHRSQIQSKIREAKLQNIQHQYWQSLPENIPNENQTSDIYKIDKELDQIDFSPEQNMLVVLRQAFILYW